MLVDLLHWRIGRRREEQQAPSLFSPASVLRLITGLRICFSHVFRMDDLWDCPAALPIRLAIDGVQLQLLSHVVSLSAAQMDEVQHTVTPTPACIDQIEVQK